MKRTILIAATISLVTGSSCGEKKEDEKNEVTTEISAPVKNGLTVKEALDSLSASDESKGKEVTINAYCWGISETTNGTVRLNLGDEKAEGMIQATFYAEFPNTKTEELNKIAKNATVTVKGKLASDAYSKFINNCELVKVD